MYALVDSSELDLYIHVPVFVFTATFMLHATQDTYTHTHTHAHTHIRADSQKQFGHDMYTVPKAWRKPTLQQRADKFLKRSQRQP
jgi:hypothetical protein